MVGLWVIMFSFISILYFAKIPTIDKYFFYNQETYIVLKTK